MKGDTDQPEPRIKTHGGLFEMELCLVCCSLAKDTSNSNVHRKTSSGKPSSTVASTKARPRTSRDNILSHARVVDKVHCLSKNEYRSKVCSRGTRYQIPSLKSVDRTTLRANPATPHVCHKPTSSSQRLPFSQPMDPTSIKTSIYSITLSSLASLPLDID